MGDQVFWLAKGNKLPEAMYNVLLNFSRNADMLLDQ
jgi:hypothetical protein